MRTYTLLLLAGLLVFGSHDGFSQQKGRDPFLAQAKPATPSGSVAAVQAEEEDYPMQVGILLEYIKVDHIAANRMIREYAPKAANAIELRDKLDKMIEDKTAELVETAWVVARSGNRAKTESIREDIYATDYDPAEIPNNIGATTSIEAKDKKEQPEAGRQAHALNQLASGTGPNIHVTNPNPAAFETRNVGVTLEVDPVLGTDNKTIDLNMAPELVVRLENSQMAREGFEATARGLEHVWMPTFYTIKDTTQITAISGNYNLIGIHTPHDDENSRILVMLKADVIKVK